MNSSQSLVSVITPTKNREHFFPLLKRCFLSQTYKNIEWLIYDDSQKKSEFFEEEIENNIFYFYSEKNLSIGEKRNWLIEHAKGDVIVHFDDDDYYSPIYIQTLLERLSDNGASFLNLRGFFLYHSTSNRYGYWDITKQDGLHYLFGPGEKGLVQFSNKNRILNLEISYGFGYCYKREVCENIKFPNKNWQEDVDFATQVVRRYNSFGIMDNLGLCIHFIHFFNTSRSFPQFLIPEIIVNRFFQSKIINEYIEIGKKI